MLAEGQRYDVNPHAPNHTFSRLQLVISEENVMFKGTLLHFGHCAEVPPVRRQKIKTPYDDFRQCLPKLYVGYLGAQARAAKVPRAAEAEAQAEREPSAGTAEGS